MSSHWSAIGFQTDPADVYEKYGNVGLQHGTQIETSKGVYVYWKCGNGVEIWFQRFKENRISISPHFAGKTFITIQLINQFQRPDDPVMDGAFYGIVRTLITGEAFEVPFLFDAPNFLVHEQKIKLPVETHVQIAAFVHTIKVWANQEAFFAEKPDVEHRLSPLSYFPVALPDADKPYPPAYASFGGIIEQSAMLTNPISGLKFWWAQARTLIGKIDIVADPDDLPQAIMPGNVFWGNFYISGIIHD